MTSLLGITISKSNLLLSYHHITELQHMNIGVKEQPSRYILYYVPEPNPDNASTIQHLKNTLKRVYSEEIYSNYNNDFGVHIIKSKPNISKRS